MRRAAAGLIAVLALAGCAMPLRANEGHPGGVPAISPAQVSEVLASYEGMREDAHATGDLERLAKAETGVSYRVDAAALQAGEAITAGLAHEGSRAYIPRVSDYPRWYVTMVSPTATPQVTTLLLFVRERAARPWRQAAAIEIPKADLLRIATDADGYAVLVAPDAPGLRVPPGALADSHVASLAGEDDEVYAADRWSDELRSAAAGDRTRFADASVSVTDAVADVPAYALRTEDGGALVLYATQRTFSGTSDVRSWQLSGVFAALAGVGEFERTLSVHWLYGWAALVPPGADGQVTVLGRSGGIYAVDGE